MQSFYQYYSDAISIAGPVYVSDLKKTSPDLYVREKRKQNVSYFVSDSII